MVLRVRAAKTRTRYGRACESSSSLSLRSSTCFSHAASSASISGLARQTKHRDVLFIGQADLGPPSLLPQLAGFP